MKRKIMKLVQIFIAAILIKSSSSSVNIIEDETSENFFDWCVEELTSFQNSSFRIPEKPDFIPQEIFDIFKDKLNTFDLSHLCSLASNEFFTEIELFQIKQLWQSDIRESLPVLYCNVCAQLEIKAKKRLKELIQSQHVFDQVLEYFPEDAWNVLEEKLIHFIEVKLSKYLNSDQSICPAFFPKCKELNSKSVASDLGGIFKNVTHCFLCTLCEFGFNLLDYEVIDSPKLYDYIYTFTNDDICPLLNFTIGIEHPFNPYSFCITGLDDIVNGIMTMIKFFMNVDVMCYQELKICDQNAFTYDLFTCMCTGVDWPDPIEKRLCPAQPKPCHPCSEGCP